MDRPRPRITTNSENSYALLITKRCRRGPRTCPHLPPRSQRIPVAAGRNGRAFGKRIQPVDCLGNLIVAEYPHRTWQEESRQPRPFPDPREIRDNGAAVEKAHGMEADFGVFPSSACGKAFEVRPQADTKSVGDVLAVGLRRATEREHPLVVFLRYFSIALTPSIPRGRSFSFSITGSSFYIGSVLLAGRIQRIQQTKKPIMSVGRVGHPSSTALTFHPRVSLGGETAKTKEAR